MSCRNNSNKTNWPLTIGVGAALGAAAYFFLNTSFSEDEHEHHERERRYEYHDYEPYEEPDQSRNRGTRSLSTSNASGNSENGRSTHPGQQSKWRNKSGRQDTCSICLEQIPAMSARTLLGCGHEFHTTCVEPWIERNANCPVCRQEVQ